LGGELLDAALARGVDAEEGDVGAAEDPAPPLLRRGDDVVEALVALAEGVDLDGDGELAVADEAGGLPRAAAVRRGARRCRVGGAGGPDGEGLVACGDGAAELGRVAPQGEGDPADAEAGSGEAGDGRGHRRAAAGRGHEVKPSPVRTCSRSTTTVPRSVSCAAASAPTRSLVPSPKVMATSTVRSRPSSSRATSRSSPSGTPVTRGSPASSSTA